MNLEEKSAQIEGKFNVADSNFESLKKQRTELDKQMAQIREEQVKLQGEHRLIKDLIAEEKAEKEKPKK